MTQQEIAMANFRIIPLALVISVTSTLIACSTAPSIPMAMAAAPGANPPDHLAHMDEQTKSMQAMHEKMMNAKTPQEQNALMAEHMKSMQDGMKMMEGMAKPGMKGMMGDMGAQHAMMEKRMAMMQTMMKMMMSRMPVTPAPSQP
jgi:hypothetical protein